MPKYVVALQPDLEEALFQIMHSRGFGDDYIRRYKMVTKFFQQKRPLIILLCGVSCTGAPYSEQLSRCYNLRADALAMVAGVTTWPVKLHCGDNESRESHQ